MNYDEKRAPVQGQRRTMGRFRAVPDGTIAWQEHVDVWEIYAQRYGRDQSAERIAERRGFGYHEAAILLGRELTTWRPVETTG